MQWHAYMHTYLQNTIEKAIDTLRETMLNFLWWNPSASSRLPLDSKISASCDFFGKLPISFAPHWTTFWEACGMPSNLPLFGFSLLSESEIYCWGKKTRDFGCRPSGGKCQRDPCWRIIGSWSFPKATIASSSNMHAATRPVNRVIFSPLHSRTLRLMVGKSFFHQLRLVVYPIIYQVWYIIQTVVNSRRISGYHQRRMSRRFPPSLDPYLTSARIKTADSEAAPACSSPWHGRTLLKPSVVHRRPKPEVFVKW